MPWEQFIAIMLYHLYGAAVLLLAAFFAPPAGANQAGRLELNTEELHANPAFTENGVFKYCDSATFYSSIQPRCPGFPALSFRVPQKNTPRADCNGQGLTPIVLPFANPANNFQTCWSLPTASTWKCGNKDPDNVYGGLVSMYPSRYLGVYLEFEDDDANMRGSVYKALLSDSACPCPPGYGVGQSCSDAPCPARDAIIAVMEEFAYNAVVQIIGPSNRGTSRIKSAMQSNSCGFPNSMLFGCGVKNYYVNNPFVDFGYDPSTGRIRLILQIMVDWNTIKEASEGRIASFGTVVYPVAACSSGVGSTYVCAAQRYFDPSNSAALRDVWVAAVSKACTPPFISAKSKSKNCTPPGNTPTPCAVPAATSSKFLSLFAKPSPKPFLRSEGAELEETRRELGEIKSKPKPKPKPSPPVKGGGVKVLSSGTKY